MYVVMLASECAPAIHEGGLGDVVSGLSREVATRGNDVEIILPKYDSMRYDRIDRLTIDYHDLWAPWYGGAIHCTVYVGFVSGLKCFFIEAHSRDNFFHRPSAYGYDDDAMRFAFFSKAALEYMLKANKRPDVIHCHDWQTGLAPVLLFEMYKYCGMENQRVCFTVHNFRHQGHCGQEVLWATGLGRPEYYLHHDRLRDSFNGAALNLAKAGIVYSNFVTTVSAQHAWEARYTDQNFGLGHTLWIHCGKFGGVLNGIDYDTWNPQTDPFIARRYGIESLDLKDENKRALRERLWLRHADKPIVAYVGRLDGQKGVHLVRDALFNALHNGAQFVLVGPSPEPAINADFSRLKSELNDNPDCHLELRFDPDLAHLVYAGADLLVVPSHFEPCGLVQMIAMKYGTVPVVRSTGGLADTVFDRDYSTRPVEARTGYVFHHADNAALDSALRRALRLWYDHPDEFRKLILNGMRCDYSWNNPARHYLDIYDYIRHK
jgi:starch synthase